MADKRSAAEKLYNFMWGPTRSQLKTIGANRKHKRKVKEATDYEKETDAVNKYKAAAKKKMKDRGIK